MHVVLSKVMEIICILSLGFFVYGSSLVLLKICISTLYAIIFLENLSISLLLHLGYYDQQNQS